MDPRTLGPLPLGFVVEGRQVVPELPAEPPTPDKSWTVAQIENLAEGLGVELPEEGDKKAKLAAVQPVIDDLKTDYDEKKLAYDDFQAARAEAIEAAQLAAEESLRASLPFNGNGGFTFDRPEAEVEAEADATDEGDGDGEGDDTGDGETTEPQKPWYEGQSEESGDDGNDNADESDNSEDAGDSEDSASADEESAAADVVIQADEGISVEEGEKLAAEVDAKVEGDEPVTEPVVNLESKTKAELVELAKEEGIEVDPKAKKAEIVETIEAAENQE